VTFDPSQPPPSLVKTQQTEWTSTSGDSVGQSNSNGLSGTQFSIPPPGYSTGIPKLDDAVKKIGDAWPDRLLAPWTHPHPSSDKSQELKALGPKTRTARKFHSSNFVKASLKTFPKSASTTT